MMRKAWVKLAITLPATLVIAALVSAFVQGEFENPDTGKIVAAVISAAIGFMGVQLAILWIEND